MVTLIGPDTLSVSLLCEKFIFFDLFSVRLDFLLVNLLLWKEYLCKNIGLNILDEICKFLDLFGINIIDSIQDIEKLWVNTWCLELTAGEISGRISSSGTFIIGIG